MLNQFLIRHVVYLFQVGNKNDESVPAPIGSSSKEVSYGFGKDPTK